MKKKNTNDVTTAKLKNVLHHAGACSLRDLASVDRSRTAKRYCPGVGSIMAGPVVETVSKRDRIHSSHFTVAIPVP
jgi:hypothetical protein